MISVGLSFASSPFAPGAPLGQSSSVFGSAALPSNPNRTMEPVTTNCEKYFMSSCYPFDQRLQHLREFFDDHRPIDPPRLSWRPDFAAENARRMGAAQAHRPAGCVLS